MNKKIDFIWSSRKDYNSLFPLFQYFKIQKNYHCKFYKIHKNKLLNKLTVPKISSYVILSHSHTYYRLKKYGWDGKFIYVDHGISPIKYYSYIYDFFFEASLLFYPGEIFKKKMEVILDGEYKKGLLGGFPIADDLFNTKIEKKILIKKYNLDATKPIILYAPTWGSKKNKLWGLNNLKHFSQIDNLITIPHPSDYAVSKIFKKTLIPKNRQELNNILHLSDIVISDISSIILEAALIKKTTIQLILDKYPGTFPSIDLKDEKISISKSLIKQEINNSNISTKPFKISFLSEDMIVDYTSTLGNINKTINEVIENPDKNLKKRNYWAEQCCWKFDGKTNERIYRMILNYIHNNQIKQLD